jgi:CRP/FNR family transcriptional regulator, cyclic AMP receptor protein
MKERFTNESGQRLLIEALATQKLVGGNADLAEQIAARGELIEVMPGTPIIEQGGWDTCLYLILAGSFEIVVNGRRIASRGPNDHVGEMAAIGPFLARSASVIAQDESVVCKLTEPQFNELGQQFPELWRRVARELAHRLIQRNNFVGKVRTKIRVFIISSVEALEIANAIQGAFEYDPFTVVVWTDGVFQASYYAIESLEQELEQTDFALVVVRPDDRTESRGEIHRSPRDNVIFELGFFMGRLGRHRTLLVEPRNESDEIKLPTDLKGISTVKYKYAAGKDLRASIGPACHQIRRIITDLGPNN